MKRITRDKVIYKFQHEMPSVARVVPGETIEVEANDCFSQQVCREDQVMTEIDYARLNPATGPIFVEGAEAGDLLQVKIIDIAVAERGVAVAVPNEGVLGARVATPTVRVLEIENGYTSFHGIRIPIKPMVGVIGVAPAKSDGDWATETPWKHGGNMDTKEITADTTLYFPVRQAGALLALGDCHAVMGDGEICFTGLEIPAVVTLQLDVIKGKSLEWPLLETAESLMILASGDTLDAALYTATDQAVALIKQALGLTWEDAYILTSLVVDMRISQVVDPKITVRAVIPKYVLSLDVLRESL